MATLVDGTAHAAGHAHGSKARSATYALALGALGVVYGDIGTSPLYAFKESLKAASRGGLATADVAVGIVSLIIWTLIVIVTVKYVILVLRADNHGEGGTLTLMALAQRTTGPKATMTVAVLGMLGASLFYGDAIITPAISVLSAVEGLELVTPASKDYVIPISVMILVPIFLFQSRGTAAVAKLFGPITACWFVVMGIAGLCHVAMHPVILSALSPVHALDFLLTQGSGSFIILGSVFLAVTGAEALYADMGHFGRKPIRMAWTFLVFPSLALNYLGQGALVIGTPEAAASPFFLMFPTWMLIPVVLLATAATVIASQAVISGAFSLTQQAIQLGLLPRMRIVETSAVSRGQVYVSRINWLLLGGVLLLVATFRSSEHLATAYGIAVTGTMVITSLLAYVVARHHWGWNPWVAGIVVAPFLCIDLMFLGANSLKIHEGGWMPILIGALIFTAMWSWRRGIGVLRAKEENQRMRLVDFIGSMRTSSVARVKGTAIFLTPYVDDVPAAFLHNLKLNRVLHATNVVMTVRIEETPRVPVEERAVVETLPDGFARVVLRFGFAEIPDVPKALPACLREGLEMDAVTPSYFMSRRSLRVSANSVLPVWQDRLFVGLSHTAINGTKHFRLPTDRSVEIGMVVDI